MTHDFLPDPDPPTSPTSPPPTEGAADFLPVGETAGDDRFGDHLLDGLTDPQRRAVTTTEGPLLVLAAAGSGKTRVITRRVAHLIAMGIPSWQILALTFTNKAAGEMRERIGTLLTSHPASDRLMRGLTVSTFHALCARLLRRHAELLAGSSNWIRPDYTIYDTADQMALIKRVLKELELSTSNWSPRTVLSTISNAKNALLDAAAFGQTAGDFFEKTIAKVYERYEAGLRAANAVDFDDLLLLTVRLLRESEEARRQVQGRWRYLMIDEYQDTNRVQFVLSTLLVGAEEGEQPNVCVVGDPDQSIYGWRGADISNILDFEGTYSGAQTIALGQNFRSTAPILRAADTLIQNNLKRKHKDLFTSAQGGELPTVVQCLDEHHEAQLITDAFRALRNGKTPTGEEIEPLAWKDMAVFYRNNALSRVMEDTLRAAGVPYVIARGTAFYQREEVKDLIAYLRVIANPADEVSLARIVNKPTRKIGKTTYNRIEAHARLHGLSVFDAMRRVDDVPGCSAAATNAVKKFVDLVDAWNGSGTFMGATVSGSLADLVERVLRESGLEKHFVAQAAKSQREDDEQKVGNLRELVSSASDFEDDYELEDDPGMGPDLDELRERREALARALDLDISELPIEETETPPPQQTPPLLGLLRAYLERVSLVADADQVDPASGAVTLMTLHAAKGLEFPAVAMIGLEEGLLPSIRALEDDAAAEEERRLAFVGITRAMRHLMITTARYRTNRGVRERTMPSRFLKELPEDGVRIDDQADAAADAFADGGGGDAGGGVWDDYDFDQTGGSERAARRKRAAARTARSRSSSSATDGFDVGTEVRHPQFGTGRILEVNGFGVNRRAKIEFEDVGRKTLILEYARLSRA